MKLCDIIFYTDFFPRIITHILNRISLAFSYKLWVKAKQLLTKTSGAHCESAQPPSMHKPLKYKIRLYFKIKRKIHKRIWAVPPPVISTSVTTQRRWLLGKDKFQGHSYGKFLNFVSEKPFASKHWVLLYNFSYTEEQQELLPYLLPY